MKATLKSNNHPLYDFYYNVNYAFKQLYDACRGGTEAAGTSIDQDPTLKSILTTNGCKIKSGCNFHQVQLTTLKDYALIFIYNAEGNETNEYFDYIEFFDVKYIVIFMDYFKPLFTEEPDKILGRSIQVDALVHIGQLFVATATNYLVLREHFTATATCIALKISPVIIAVCVIGGLINLKDDDCSMMKVSEVKKLVSSNPIQNIFCGLVR